MDSPFLAKLGAAGDDPIGLTDDDRALLESICHDVRICRARRDIVREGESADHVHLILAGWACRYKVTPDGSRQIMAFMLPGDFCDTHITLFGEMDHSIGTLTECRAATISAQKMSELMDRPTLARAFWWASLVDEAILRSWIVSLGRRDAFDRLGLLMCELHARLEMVGLAEPGSFSLPLTQDDLADTLGLTAVHTNRTLKRYREENLLTFKGGLLIVEDLKRLQARVAFDANYLHLPRRTRAHRPQAEERQLGIERVR